MVEDSDLANVDKTEVTELLCVGINQQSCFIERSKDKDFANVNVHRQT